MAEALSEKATSTLTEAKESVSTTAETVKASLTDAEKTVAASTETARTSLTDAEKTVASSAETVKTEAPKKVADVSTKAREVVDNSVSRGFEGAKNLFHTLDEKRTEVSSKLVGAVTNVVSGASSSTVASRDLPVSTDNQPLLTGDRGVETTPWWKNCCGVLDLLKSNNNLVEVNSGSTGLPFPQQTRKPTYGFGLLQWQQQQNCLILQLPQVGTTPTPITWFQ